MKIFHEFTKRCLKENKTRTIVTIIGIVLSMSLFTAVIEGAYSGIKYIHRCVIAEQGSWSASYIGAGEDDIEALKSDKAVKKTGVWTEVGWAESGSSNTYKPYLLIESMGEGFTDLVKVNLLDGRMPENENEILLPEHLSKNGDVFYPVGTVLELTVGRRTTLDEKIIGHAIGYDPENEKLSWTFEKTYTVVGHYSRFEVDVEDRSCPGYTALTVGSAKGETDVFYELKNPVTFKKFEARLYEEMGFDHTKTVTHYDLLHVYGVMGRAELSSAIWGFAGILVALVFFGSVSLIYNSFSISVSERTKLFGLLKSVGATKKQIRSTVNYEAFLLAAIGIPIGLVVGCLGIGITLYALRDNFKASFFTGYAALDTEVQMKLVLNPWALLLAAAICFITTMISANRPAGRAIRISPIESVRQSQDVNIKAREVKTSKLTLKLFGFEGMLASKNFKRNRKRYRSVVLSLFMSVVLFITASSFCKYLTASVKGATGYGQVPDIHYYSTGESMEEAKETMRLLSEVPGVDHGYMYSSIYEYMSVGKDSADEKLLAPEYSVYFDSWAKIPDAVSMYYQIYLVDDATFKYYCEASGADYEYLCSKDDPKALMINRMIRYDDSGLDRILKEDSLPCVCHLSIVKDIEGYYFYRTGNENSEDGSFRYIYYPEEHMNDYWDGRVSELDPEKALVLSYEEAIEMTPIKIGAFASEEVADNFDGGAVIYPYSAAETVFGAEKAADYCQYRDVFFFADNHTAVYDHMKTVLVERGIDTGRLYDYAEEYETVNMVVTIINVFSYGFIILISLIALANVFNTISTNIMLRRREFAMLKSVGMSEKGFSKMMNYECIIYGVKGLGWGIPVSVLTTLLTYMVSRNMFDEMKFFIPFGGFAIAIGSVFLVVFVTMLFSMKKIKADNPIDALKNENI